MADIAKHIASLQELVLSWNYNEIFRDFEAGKAPDDLKQVPEEFTSTEQYVSVFEPLMVQECLAQVVHGADEIAKEPVTCVVTAVESSDRFDTVEVLMNAGDTQDFKENDLVLLAKERPAGGAVVREVGAVHALGMVESLRRDRAWVRLCLADHTHQGAGRVRSQSVRAALGEKHCGFWCVRLANLSTIVREWVALHRVDAIPYKDLLMSGKRLEGSGKAAGRAMDVPRGMAEAMELAYNPAQLSAAKAGLDGSPLVLIKGPPGTGKTSTIMALLSIVLHAVPAGHAGGVGKEAPSARSSATPTAANSASDGTHDDAFVSLHRRAAPWLGADEDTVDPRDALPSSPHTATEGADLFGMARRVDPRPVGSGGPRARVLVCAPSNSALDEVVVRVMQQGLLAPDGTAFTPGLVRIGVHPHHSVQAVALDSLVAARLGGQKAPTGKDGKELDFTRAQKDQVRMSILEEASVVCSTLSFAGSGVFAKMTAPFDVVIIDEAAQAVEPSTLVPLSQGARQCYLVGDPNQLPATVISNTAKKYGYDCSLFKRLEAAGHPVCMLTTQFRMHPEIRRFPSEAFYENKLQDGPDVADRSSRPWHSEPCLGPFAFWDVRGSEERQSAGASLVNRAEATCAVRLLQHLFKCYPTLRPRDVGVISPYLAQVRHLRDCLSRDLGPSASELDVNTIDGYQGREKDVVIFSAVRTGASGAIGFVADERRMNVGLTRGRCSVIVMGNAPALRASQSSWRALVESALSRNVLYRVEGSDVETSVAALLGGGVGPVACDDGELTRPVRERRGKRGKRGRGEEGEGVDAWEGEGEEPTNDGDAGDAEGEEGAGKGGKGAKKRRGGKK